MRRTDSPPPMINSLRAPSTVFDYRRRAKTLRRREKSTGQRPTLPRGEPRSTIGAGGLNCRVRNGNGCLPAAVVTQYLSQLVNARTRLPGAPRRPDLGGPRD